MLVCPLSQLASVTLTALVKFAPLNNITPVWLTFNAPCACALLICGGVGGGGATASTLIVPTVCSGDASLAFHPAACAPATRGVHW